MSSKAARRKTTKPQYGQQPKQKQPQAQSQAQARPQPRPQPATTSQPQPKAVTSDSQTARREARMERQATRVAAAEQRKRMRTIRRYGIIGGIVVVLLGVFVAVYLNEANKPGESVAAMANRQHIAAGTAAEYNSDPPTNGPHVDAVPQFKVYTEPITKELAVHGLEDGGVIINYKPDLDKPTVDKLATIATSYQELAGGRSHVVMYPYPGLSHPIVLTAWRRIDRLAEFDEPRIRRFIDAYVGIDHHEGSEGRRIP